MQKGTKIAVTVYGQTLTGTVSRMGTSGSIVFAIMDNTGKERWFHRNSLTVSNPS